MQYLLRSDTTPQQDKAPQTTSQTTRTKTNRTKINKPLTEPEKTN
jgi:hypothetical protein